MGERVLQQGTMCKRPARNSICSRKDLEGAFVQNGEIDKISNLKVSCVLHLVAERTRTQEENAMSWRDWPIIPSERSRQQILREDFINAFRELNNVVNKTERKCLENIEHLILNPPDGLIYYEWRDKLSRGFEQMRGYNTQHNNTWHPVLWENLEAVVNQLTEQLGRYLMPPPEEEDTPPAEPEDQEPTPAPPPTTLGAATTPGVIELVFGMLDGHALTPVLTPDRLQHLLEEPPGPATFTITESWKVTFLYTYPHGRVVEGDVTPGTIGLRAADSTTYGPWRAFGKMQFAEPVGSMMSGSMLGSDIEPNELWEATPNVVIPPGIYTVLVSDPESWGLCAMGLGIRAKFLAVS